MKHYRMMMIVAVLMMCLQVNADTTTFKVDPVHSSLNFEIRHLYSTFVGRFNSYSGTIVADMEKETLVSVRAEVDVLSIDTTNKDRDKHLLADDFLRSSKHPTATFVSTAVKKGKDGEGSVTGDITISGITKEVTFVGKFLGYGPDMNKGRRAGFHATTIIDRTDFGIKYGHALESGLTSLGTEVKLVLNLEVIEVIEPKSLATTIQEFKSKNKRPMAPEVKAALDAAGEQIRAQGNVSGLRTGSKAPDFKLPDGDGHKIRLSKLLKKGPVVLVFYRGEWCPFCNLQLRALEEVYPDIRKLGASLIAIAPQQEKNAASQKEDNKLSYPLLSDTKGDAMRDYKLLYKVPAELKKVFLERYSIDLEKYNGADRWVLPVTATYIIGQDGIIKAGLVDLDYTKRMEPQDILKALAEKTTGE